MTIFLVALAAFYEEKSMTVIFLGKKVVSCWVQKNVLKKRVIF